jgi:hypothetical protein
LKEETNLVSFDNFKEKKFIVALELVFLDSNIKKEVCGVLDFYFLKRKYEKKGFITCCL